MIALKDNGNDERGMSKAMYVKNEPNGYTISPQFDFKYQS